MNIYIIMYTDTKRVWHTQGTIYSDVQTAMKVAQELSTGNPNYTFYVITPDKVGKPYFKGEPTTDWADEDD